MVQPNAAQYFSIYIGTFQKKIYARNCSIIELCNAAVKPFLTANHLQGARNAHVNLALIYNDEIVQVMTFSKHRKYEWEIIRECCALNTVVGGVSKLFHYFITKYNPSQVMSYCDFNKFSGSSYLKIGMNFDGYTGPDMKWLLPDGQVVNRNPRKNSELRQQALAQLWGAGSKRFIWRSSNG